MLVRPGNPDPPGVKVIVSSAADQVNAPLMGGTVVKAACTLLVFIGLLNWSTMGAKVETLVASCIGELVITTGWSGCHCDCAMNILADIAGTDIEGISGPVPTVTASLGLSRFTSVISAG